MRTFIRRARRCAGAGVLALSTAVAAAAATDPANYAPATITVGDQVMDKAWVKIETITSIVFVTGDTPDSPAQLEKRHGEYAVEYKDSANIAFLKAQHSLQVKAWDKAMGQFADALPGLKYDWEKETALIEGARCAEALKKYDDGIADLVQFEKDFPQSVRIGDALDELAKLKALKGDAAGADTEYTNLINHEKDLGPAVASRGAAGKAEGLLAAGKAADAETLLTPWFTGKVNAGTDPEAYARIGLLLAKAQAGNNEAANAIATLRTVAYTPVEPTVQARAHLEWAKLLASDPSAAFDQAALALSPKDVDGDVRTEAYQFAAALVPKMGADLDAAGKAKLAFEYKNYLGRLK